MLAVSLLAVAALLVAIAAVTYALDCRDDRDAALFALEAERSIKVEALRQLRTLRHRICSVCTAEDTYTRKRVTIASVRPQPPQ